MKRWKLFVFALILGVTGLAYYFLRIHHPCRKAYSALTKDGALTILVTFGYKDSRPLRFVGDRYERAVFVDRLLRPCTPFEVVCGFEQESGNPEFFSKKLIWYDHRERVVQVQVLASSVGPDDEWNRSSRIQKWHSERTLRLFRRAMVKSDVVFYDGHSRTGGGPDFFPPLLRKNNQVDYGHYQKEKPGVQFLLADLERAKGSRQPRLLGLFSCDSSVHFQKTLLKAKPKMGLIASEALLHQSDAMDNMVSALSALLKGECSEKFNERLRSGDPMRGSQIVGFF
ncbi:MAG: hypothetical protein AB7F86_05395 [Bdellovibrionales bacterium]